MSVIAVDFDGTIARYEHCMYPSIGEPVPYAREVINRLVASGHHIVIWTCRNHSEVLKLWFKENGFTYHEINVQSKYDAWEPSPKIIADLYIDDKGIGCPLVRDDGAPYVDWMGIEYLLKEEGYYTIQL